MRLTIFGGTGASGRLLIEQALAAGHHVTAYARTTSNLPVDERVHAIAGALEDADKISEAIEGSDAVLSLLGVSTNKADAQQVLIGYEHIIAAMKEHKVDRLVVTGTSIIKDPDDGKNLKINTMISILRLVQRHVYNAIAGIGDLVRASGLKWTIVRLPFLSNGPATTTITAGPLGKRASLELSRANVAAYLLAQASDEGQIHKAPFVTDN